ncbi:Bcr/CflA family multidrug efflux MFS transporter [Bdellovibrio bacteriovorus]|uniref:Drug resistance transporter, Bcr/CflA family n=1 Tax=Bdellovibrio bacteriovorus (strain ATCC 15356 / DSM 50701 / NCIMB 9529 / HD100) TaxID=264462 RepID=Q6MQR5_BDEBA|nr:Bcr/CflA family multidrug efflux MFS transporter [Bdellovibrio bacteriovorus]AHZ86020.1 major facilitator transporter [Bdellovibrio bacteriovorus]BEV66943.1 Bicyclomycin resistance protein [Bdellovibrio bacteriovorus]CAE78382.1 drug resistance transporter, Bcr/CflA family [Bdellovibrio bacteriovorus HD100]
MQSSAKPNTPFALLILLLASLTAFGPLSIDMYLPAFPAIAENLNVPLSSVQMSLASFFIGLATGQIFYGPITDRFGRKKPLYVGLGIYALASLVCAFTKNVEMLILFRFLQALGSCAGVVISRAIVRDLFTHQETARVFSLLMLVMGVAPILAPFFGGYISEFFGWRAIFALMVIISTSCIVMLAIFLPETHQPDQRVHIKDSLKNYVQIIKDRHFMGYALAGGAAQAGLFAYITGSSFVFINLFEIPAKSFGWVFGSNAIGLIACSQINARLLKRLSYDVILEKIFVVLGVLGVILAMAGIFNWGFWGLAIPLFLFIAALGMTFPNATAGAMATQRKAAGSASALLGTLQYGIAALSSAAVSRLHDGTTLPMCAMIGFCGVLALALHRLLVKKAA